MIVVVVVVVVEDGNVVEIPQNEYCALVQLVEAVVPSMSWQWIQRSLPCDY
jgi:hypothetical protein